MHVLVANAFRSQSEDIGVEFVVAYSRPADSYGACIETALPGAAVGALVGMLLTFKIFSIPTDIFAVLISVVVISGARAGKLYLDTKQTPSASDLQSVDVGSLKWPSL